jgi:hypothetical protein
MSKSGVRREPPSLKLRRLKGVGREVEVEAEAEVENIISRVSPCKLRVLRGKKKASGVRHEA